MLLTYSQDPLNRKAKNVINDIDNNAELPSVVGVVVQSRGGPIKDADLEGNEQNISQKAQAAQQPAGEEITLLDNKSIKSESDKSIKSKASSDGENRVGFWGFTVNLIQCGLGAGILSMPKNVAAAGIFNAAFW